MMDETWVATILLLLLSVWLLYRYLMQPYDYWEKLGIPSLPAIPIFGSVAGVFFEHLHIVEVERYKKYGRMYGYYEMRTPVLVVGDLKLIRDIMVKDFQSFPSGRIFPETDPITRNMLFVARGEKWKRLRTIVSPIFASGKIKKMFSIIADSAKIATENFSKAAKSGESIDMKNYFGAFTIDVIASAAFGTKIDSHNDPKNAFVKYASMIFGSPLRFGVAALAPKLAKAFNICIFEPRSLDFFKQAVLQIIEERRTTGKKRNDFLQLLMEAEYDESSSAKEADDDDEGIKTDKTTDLDNGDNTSQRIKVFHNKRLNHDELVSQCVLFFLAGYETTSSTLSFVAYTLALHPEWQEKVIQEIDDCLRDNKDGLTYDAVMQMKCLDMVVSETMRLLSPAVRSERRADTDYKLGDLNIPKGMVIQIPICAIQHDPEYFPDPYKFDPNRFSAEEKAKRDPYCYMPFGAGPRNCIAMRFALVEVKTCLAYVLTRIRFKRSPKTLVPLEFKRGENFLQARNVWLQVEERTDYVV